MLCRLCLCETNQDKAVKLLKNDDNSRVKLIAKYLHVEVFPNDKISTSIANRCDIICESCDKNLCNFHSFFILVKRRQFPLRIALQQDASWDEKNEKESFSDQNNVKKLVATLKDDEYDDVEFLFDVIDSTKVNALDDEDLCEAESILDSEDFSAATKVLEADNLSEAESLLDTSKTAEMLVDAVLREAGSLLVINDGSTGEIEFLDETMPNREFNSDNDCDELKDQDKFEVDNETEKKIAMKRTNDKMKRVAIRCTWNSSGRQKAKRMNEMNAESLNEISISCEAPDKRSCNNLTAEMKNNIIAEYMQLKCDICQKPAKEFAELRTHFRQEHNKEGYAKCCGKQIRRRHLLVEHIQVHLNPDHFKCEICNKVFKTVNNLDSHKANMHTDKKVLKHLCTLCKRRFAHKTNLTSHMFTHVEERKYQCNVCEKCFKSAKVLKAHTQAMHEKFIPHMCDICGKEYKSKQAFDRHVSKHRGPTNVPKKPCKICEKWYSIDYLPRHERRAHELMNVDCEKCGKTFKSKTALSYHMLNFHRNKPVYPCTMCDKKFDRPAYLKEHIYKHTGEKTYSCSYCSREFCSRSSMYRHSRKIHFDQWKEAQSKRNQTPSNTTAISKSINISET